MAKVVSVVNTPQKEKIPYKLICMRCGNASKNDFYVSSNKHYKYIGEKIPWCKTCITEQYDEYFKKYGDGKLAIYFLCRKFDIFFSSSAYDGAVRNSIKTGWSVTQSYFKQINSFRDANSYGTCFDESHDFLERTPRAIIEDESDFEVSPDIVRFWGINFEEEDYEFLTEKLQEYLNAYECESPVMEELLKQASYESLEIQNKRQRKEDVSKNLKNLQDLLGTANIKPNQETGANATDQATFGLLIKKWENEEPVPEPAEEWRDVDGIGKYIRVWFLGHLCKMLGITNEYSQEYEEEMARLRVEMPLSSSDEELEEGD